MERIASLVRRSNATGSQQGEEPGDEAEEEDGEVDTRLFHCAGCDVTYISREMESCSSCGRTVERIPNERELDRFQLH